MGKTDVLTCASCAVLVVVGILPAGEAREVRTLEVFSAHIRKILQDDVEKFRSRGELTPKEEEIVLNLIDPKTEVKKCEEAVLDYMRERSKQLPPPPFKYSARLYSEYQKGIGGIPAALFWLKGDPSGIYEYYKLTGGGRVLDGCGGYDDVVIPSTAIRQELIKIEAMYCLDDLFGEMKRMYVLGEPLLFADQLQDVNRLLKLYGQDPRISKLIMDYPFLSGSYVQVRAARDAKHSFMSKQPSVEELLLEYYSTLISRESDRLLFLKRIRRIYGDEAFAFVIGHATGDSPVTEGFYLEALKLAVDNGMWDLAQAMCMRGTGHQEEKVSILLEKQKKMEQDASNLKAILNAVGKPK